MINNRDIQINGKTICDFLELRIVDKRAKKDPVYVIPFSTIRRLEYFHSSHPYIEIEDELRAGETLFHCNWTWIMKVKEKIEAVSKENVILEQCSITTGGCIIQAMKIPFLNHKEDRLLAVHRTGDTEAWEGYAETDVEAFYKACLDYINWYNKLIH